MARNVRNLIGILVVATLLQGCCTVQTVSDNVNRSGLQNDVRMQNAIHVQNVRTVLRALAEAQRGNVEASRVALFQLLSDELTLLNGFDPSAAPKREHAALCDWRAYIESARDIADNDAKTIPPLNTNASSQVASLERSLRILSAVCLAN